MRRLFTAVLLALVPVLALRAQTIDSSLQTLITSPATVSDLIADSDGTILVSGNFNFVNGQRCDRIVRLRPDGTKVPGFQAEFADTIVTAIAVQPDGKILLGGFIPETPDTDEIGVVLRLFPNGQADPSFQPAVFNDRVLQVAALDDQTILVGGLFSEHAGMRGSGLAVLAPDGSPRQVISLDPPGSMDTANVFQIKVMPDNNGYYVSGNRGFDGILFRLDASGVIDTTFQINTVFPDGDFMTSIQHLMLDGDQLWLGTFTWQFNPRLVRVASDGQILSEQSIPNPQDIAIGPDGIPLVAGVVEGRPDAYRVDSTGLHPYASGPAADEFVYHLLPMPDGSLIAAGEFSFYKGFPFESIMRFTPDGQPDLTFFTRLQRSGVVRKVHALPDGRMIIAGRFTQVNQREAIHLARLNPDGTLDPSFALNVIPREHSVNDLVVQNDGHLLIATNGRRLNEDPYFPVLRLQPNGTPDTIFATGFEDTALGDARGVVATPDSMIIAYGSFTFTNNGTRYSRIARFDYQGRLDTSFSARVVANEVNDVYVYPNGVLMLGGEKIRIGGGAAQAVIRIFPRGNIDSSFLPEINPESEVYNIFELQSTKIILTGRLRGLNRSSSLMRLFPDGRIDRTFDWIPDNPDRFPDSWPRKVIPQRQDSFLLSNRPGEEGALFLQMDRDGLLSEAFRPGFPAFTGDLFLVNDSTLLVGGSFLNPVGGSGLLRVHLNRDPPLITQTNVVPAVTPLRIYPNPVIERRFFVHLPQNWTNQPAQLDLFDLRGRLLSQIAVVDQKQEIMLPSVVEGLVIARLTQGRQQARAVLIIPD